MNFSHIARLVLAYFLFIISGHTYIYIATRATLTSPVFFCPENPLARKILYIIMSKYIAIR